MRRETVKARASRSKIRRSVRTSLFLWNLWEMYLSGEIKAVMVIETASN